LGREEKEAIKVYDEMIERFKDSKENNILELVAKTLVNKIETNIISGNTKHVMWTSSNNNVAEVSSKGRVKAIAPGKAIITALVGKNKYFCKVTVARNTGNTLISC
jgi:uncharacterized protein YjdB